MTTCTAEALNKLKEREISISITMKNKVEVIGIMCQEIRKLVWRNK